MKLIIITGPTACGKTSIAAKLANEINGEIISADSRQIYKGMDIGTGKDLDEYQIHGNKIPYHLIDILDPLQNYSVYDFQKDFSKSCEIIKNNKRIPILCGGTGLYIESILLDYDLSKKPPPNTKLREELATYSKDTLIKKLQEQSNKHDISKMVINTKKQIIRNIEIINSSSTTSGFTLEPLNDSALVIGLDIDREFLREKIKKRLVDRIKAGMIDEVKKLIKKGVPIDRFDYFGLEYRFISSYIKGDIEKDEMVQSLITSIRKFAKRQRTWFRRMEKRGVDIKWVSYNDYESIIKLTNNYINEL